MPQEVQMAMGRIFGMMQRPEQDGDAAEYERCRALILDAAEGRYDRPDHRPCYSRDYGKGAAGQWD